jgi:hypothetical protein
VVLGLRGANRKSRGEERFLAGLTFFFSLPLTIFSVYSNVLFSGFGRRGCCVFVFGRQQQQQKINFALTFNKPSNRLMMDCLQVSTSTSYTRPSNGVLDQARLMDGY